MKHVSNVAIPLSEITNPDLPMPRVKFSVLMSFM